MLTSAGAGTAPVWSNVAASIGNYAWALGGNTLSSQQNFGTLNNYPIPFYTNNAERMRIDASGNVGIGTTAPIAPLDFGNAALGNKLFLWQGSTSNSYGFGIQNSLLQTFAATGADIAFGTGASSNFTEAMRIKSSGNVGIGDATPNNKLEITQGTSGNSGLRFTNLTSANTPVTNPSTQNGVLGVNANGDVVLVKENSAALATSANNAGSNCSTCGGIRTHYHPPQVQ